MQEQELPIRSVCDEVVNIAGLRPSVKAVWNAIQMVDRSRDTGGVPRTKYGNSGRPSLLSPEQERAVMSFVKEHRNKRFCCCRYIRTVLKLKCTKRTIARVLNRNGYHWRTVPKVRGFSDDELQKRKDWVEQYVGKKPEWWQNHMNLVIDGVTLTMAPRPLDKRQRHMAQSIRHMWMRKGEETDPNCHVYNRYGIQLGTKVPLWGGFTGGGSFTLRLWTPRPKMVKEEWAKHVPALKRAVDAGGCSSQNKRAKVWQDGEGFLQQPDLYAKNGLTLTRFPPNSGDLNPIETVWAWLRRDLALREQEDFNAKKVLTKAQFRQRAAQILKSYEQKAPGQTWSRLQKLVRGMPARLAKSKARRYGRCGK